MKNWKERLSEPYRKLLYTRLPPELDRRRKLPVSEHAEICKRHANGESQRALARAYGVSRRLIVFILHPERLQKQRKRKSETHYSQKYYQAKTKGKNWAETMREHRHYKKRVMKNIIK